MESLLSSYSRSEKSDSHSPWAKASRIIKQRWMVRGRKKLDRDVCEIEAKQIRSRDGRQQRGEFEREENKGEEARRETEYTVMQ